MRRSGSRTNALAWRPAVPEIAGKRRLSRKLISARRREADVKAWCALPAARKLALQATAPAALERNFDEHCPRHRMLLWLWSRHRELLPGPRLDGDRHDAHSARRLAAAIGPPAHPAT